MCYACYCLFRKTNTSLNFISNITQDIQTVPGYPLELPASQSKCPAGTVVQLITKYIITTAKENELCKDGDQHQRKRRGQCFVFKRWILFVLQFRLLICKLLTGPFTSIIIFLHVVDGSFWANYGGLTPPMLRRGIQYMTEWQNQYQNYVLCFSNLELQICNLTLFKYKYNPIILFGITFKTIKH